LEGRAKWALDQKWGKPNLRLVKPTWEKVLTDHEIVLGLPGYQITRMERKAAK